jgi:hypothetical protein
MNIIPIKALTGNILTGNSNVIEIDEASTNNIIEVNNITS